MKRYSFFAASASLLGILSACSLIYTENAEQCATTADCVGRGGGFAATVCGPTKTCDPTYCYTNDDCKAKGPSFAGTVCGDTHECKLDPTVSCQTNAQCMDTFNPPGSSDGGKASRPYFCRKTDNKCVALTNEDCPTVRATDAALRNDDTQYAIMSLPLSSTNFAYAYSQQNSANYAEVAFRDFETAIPAGIPVKGKNYPVAWINCDENLRGQNPDGTGLYTQGLEYMAKEVGVRYIVRSTAGLGGQVGFRAMQPYNVVTYEIGAPDSTIATIDTGSPGAPAGTRLMYREGIPAEDLPKMGLQVVPQLEALQKGPGGNVPDGSPMKVAVFYSGLLEQLGQVFNQATFFNGKPAAQQPENYKSFNVGDADPSTPVGVDKITQLAQQVAAFEPHMVILLGLQETIAEMKAVEAVWTNGDFRPRYFQPFPTGTAFWGPINPTTDPGLLERFTFINQFAPGGPGVEAKKRGIGPNLPFPNYAEIGTPALIPAYDAVYVGYFLLAGQLATGQPVTNGASLAATMPFLQPASPPDDRKKIQAVKEQINEAITILGSGGKIDLEGAATSLNYTPTGGSPWVFELDCFRLVSGVLKDGTRGLKWDSIADKFSGTINPTCGDFPAQ